MGEVAHRIDNHWFTAMIAAPDIIVKGLGGFTELVVVRNIKGWQKGRVQPFISIEGDSVSLALGQFTEIHIYQAFITLDHPILQTGRNTEFFCFNRQYQ